MAWTSFVNYIHSKFNFAHISLNINFLNPNASIKYKMLLYKTIYIPQNYSLCLRVCSFAKASNLDKMQTMQNITYYKKSPSTLSPENSELNPLEKPLKL